MKKILLLLFSVFIVALLLFGCQSKTVYKSSDILCKTEYELIASDPKSKKMIITSTETNLGNFCADAFRNAEGSDVALLCGGEIRDGISKGEIAYEDLNGIFFEESRLVTVRATGAEILDCLEIAYSLFPEPDPYFMHLSGISVIVDMNVASSVETDEVGSVAEIGTSDRVKDVHIGGEAIRAEGTYAVTFSDSMSEKISNIFKGKRKVSSKSNIDAVITYITRTNRGKIGDAYKEPFGDGRIGVIPMGQTVPVLSDASLPQVYITVSDSISGENYVPCKITVHDPTGVYRDIYDSSSKVKLRGNSTSKGEKAPYNIKFSSETELLGLGVGKKWNLLANLYDKTQLRNTIAYTFAQDVGINYVSNSSFAELYLNGEYRGMYQLCEPVEVGESLVDIDIGANDFLLEVEPYEGYSNTYCLLTPKFEILLGFNEPEEPTEAEREWLTELFGKIEDAITFGDYDRVKELVDVDSVARNYIVQELFKNVDYFQSSTRFYIKEGKLYEGPVWDFDLSMGNCSDSYYPVYNNIKTSGRSYEGIYCVTLYNEYLFEYEEFRSLVRELYGELQPMIVNLYKENELGASMIDRLWDEYDAAIERNNTLWSMQEVYSRYEHEPVDGSYEGEIEFLKDWLEKRNLWLCDHYCID